jgi:hypothetical protein
MKAKELIVEHLQKSAQGVRKLLENLVLQISPALRSSEMSANKWVVEARANQAEHSVLKTRELEFALVQKSEQLASARRALFGRGVPRQWSRGGSCSFGEWAGEARTGAGARSLGGLETRT